MINLTPHPINIRVDDNVTIQIEPSTKFEPIRIKTEDILVDHYHIRFMGKDYDIPIYASTNKRVSALPPEQPGELYIVSQLVSSTCDRKDFVYPSDLIRDESGFIMACMSFSRKLK